MRVCHSDVSARSHAHMHTCTHACMHTHGTRSGRIVGIECAFSWVIVCGSHGLVAPTERQPHVSCSSVRACQHRGSASNTHTPHTSERMRSSRATNPHPSAPAPPYPSKVGYISLPLPAHVHPMRHPTLAHTHTGTRPQHQTHQTPTHQTHGAKLDPSRTRTRARARARARARRPCSAHSTCARATWNQYSGSGWRGVGAVMVPCASQGMHHSAHAATPASMAAPAPRRHMLIKSVCLSGLL